MKILLLSPYDAGSHKRWRLGLEKYLPDLDVTTLSLPPRHFNWRLRSNSLTFAFGDYPQLSGRYDLLIATSMTDLSSLKGMFPKLGEVPAIVYFHENQFAYPEQDSGHYWLESRILNLYTALSANRVVFNSAYNRDSFLTGVERLLARMPDGVPTGIADRLKVASCVLPVPLETECFVSGTDSDRFTLVWNHRWEYDKGPDRLLALVQNLLERQVDFVLHLLGQKFREIPDAIDQLIALLRERKCLGHCGYVEDQEAYRRLLMESDLIISTAVQEFQGLSVLEAVAADCIPVVPDRLAYRETFDSAFRYRTSADIREEAEAAATRIAHCKELKDSGQLPAPPAVEHLAWETLAKDYLGLFEKVIHD